MKSCGMCEGGEHTTTAIGEEGMKRNNEKVKSNQTLILCFIAECMDEMPEEECAKIVEKGKCKKRGDLCMKSCDMCKSGEDTTTAAGGMNE